MSAATQPMASPISINPTITLVNVDPSVVFNILDHHSRRGVKQTRVIGALYGVVCHEVINIRQMIPILYEEDPAKESLSVSIPLWENMARSSRKVQLAPLIGWYASETSPMDVNIDQIVSARIGASNPSIRLILDASLKHNSLRLRVLCSTEVTLMEKATRLYRPVEFNVKPCNAVQAAVLDGLIAMVNPNRIAAQRMAIGCASGSSSGQSNAAAAAASGSANTSSTSAPVGALSGTSASASPSSLKVASGSGISSTSEQPAADSSIVEIQPVPSTIHRLRDELDMLLVQIERMLQQPKNGSTVSLTSEQLFEIQKALRSVPQFPSALAAALRDGAVQDGATMQYLARLINVQVTLVDRLLALVHS